MLRPLITVAAAVALLAGCSGGDDKSSDSSSDGAQSSASTPAAPEIASYDPPKAFAPVSALAEPRTPGNNDYTIETGMVDQTALLANLDGITGRNVAGLLSWQVSSKEEPTTKTSDLTKPMSVQLDGKEVIAMAYVQRVQGSGTQKARGQVNFQWIDPADGKVVSSIALDLTPALGPDNTGKDFISQAYDVATGQIAVTISPGSDVIGKKVGRFTVFADPKTKKATVIPFLQAGGLLDGVIAGVTGTSQEGATDLAIVTADAATGTIKKKTPVKMNYLYPAGTGGKRAYLSGSAWVPESAPGMPHGYRASTLYSVDILSGAVTAVTSPLKEELRSVGYACWPDQKSAVVCQGTRGLEQVEIIGMDDSTGKKAWGYSTASASRVVPKVTTVFHGLVYAQAEALPVVMDAATGQDVPTPTATPADGATPTEGSTPTDGVSPTGDPTSDPTGDPSSSSGNIGGWGDLSLLYGKPESPDGVSKYGSVFLLDPGDKAPMGTETIFVVQKAIS